jgi:hypothetical protein
VKDAKDAKDAPPGDSPKLDERTGELRTPPEAHEHRVFVDGRVVAYESGAIVRVTCGPHVVRIGSKGATQLVHVPCGGSVGVEAK